MTSTDTEMILTPIGSVASSLKTPSLRASGQGLEQNCPEKDAFREHDKIKNMISHIHVFEDSALRLKGIEAFSHILVLYWPHLIDPEKRKLEQVHPMGRPDIEKQGIFATCSPARPNPVLVSVVALEKREGTVLTVRGLEAVDESPVIDIKPYNPHYLVAEDLKIPDWMAGH